MPYERPADDEEAATKDREYNELLDRIRALKASDADETEALADASRQLKALKKSKWRKRGTAPVRKVLPVLGPDQYPPLDHMPLDEGGFVRSFPPPSRATAAEAAAATEFWDRYGVCVFHGVLTPAECEATVDEVWSYMEPITPGLRRDAPETYHGLSSATYGLAPEPAIFTRQVTLRVAAALHTRLPSDEAAATAF
jgi:hypothetical protein